jgi:pyruvate,water dikinase
MLAERIELTDIGGWHYVRTVPLGGRDRNPPPALVLRLMVRLHPTMRARAKTAREVVRDGGGTQVVEQWLGELQSELLARHEALLAVELPRLSDESLIEHFASVISLVRDGLGSHVRVVGAVMIETAPLLSAARELLGWVPLKALELVAGLSFRSSEPARELAKLADRVRINPALVAVLDDITSETSAAIAKIDPDFALDLERYRRYYGARGLSRDPADPTIADRPELLLRMLAGQIVRGHDPSELDRLNGTHRAQRLEEARGALRTRTTDERARFDAALARAERAYPLREDNVFVALQAPVGLIRYAALEVGRRLAERGQVHQPEDAFFLEYAELIRALGDRHDARDIVSRRKGEREWVLAHPGPASYGTPLGRPPSLRYLPAELRELTEAFFSFMSLAIDTGTAHDSVATGIRGVPGSPGRYSGPVRVVTDEGQFDKIEPGDVIVCPVTQPTWSVIFPLLGAVVTDSGGVLSHPAIIAREYRIPAVVATGNATELLRDGELVTVDGSAGTVKLVS